ncbi:MAG TPA: hypothetical protein VF613_00960 [Longimicrobium sp.]|jgi:hypothetical protein
MNALRQRSPLLPFALLAAAVYAAEIVAAQHIAGSPAPGVLAAAVVFDLAVALPAAYWWFFVRGRGPALRVVPVVALSLAGAWAVLPAAHRGIIDSARFLLIPLEVAAVGMVLRAIVRSIPPGGDAVERIGEAARAALPHRAAADAVAYEITLFYLALLSWRARPHVPAGATAFNTHRRSGYAGLVVAVAMMSVVEGAVVHLLAARWSVAAAWTLTALSVYGVVWMVGDLQAIRLRPTLVDDEALHVRVGLRWDVRIPWSQIEAVEPRGAASFPRRAPGHLRATPMGEPAIVLTLRRPMRVRGPYGISRTVTRLGIAVDDPRAFLSHMRHRG